MSYNTPLPAFVSSQRLSNISLAGSNFGPYLAVVPRTTICSAFAANLLKKNSSSFVCNSSDLNIQDAGVTVAEAAVNIVFADARRLDDVVVSLWSPQGKEYVLIRNKCYGALPCGALNSVGFNLQILPIASLAGVPSVNCPSAGTYVPDGSDVDLLR
jgi:hypothetical protein